MNELFAERLRQIDVKGQIRSLTPRIGVDLSSNDYLGFAEDNVLRERFLQRINEFPNGAAGSRLLRGSLELFDEIETALANFVGREQALLFPSGYQANLAVLSALLRPDDIVFSDALNHASIIDGIRLSKAEKVIYPHQDLQILEDHLKAQQSRKRLKLIVTESLFSMEGTLADLKEIVALAEKYGASVVVDEAHSTGLWGASLVAGLGLQDQVLATVHAGGKAMGASGAWVAGSMLLKEYLINFARPFMFTTAPVPALAVLLQEAARFYGEQGSERATAVLQRAEKAKSLLPPLVTPSITGPILPIFVGDNHAALEISRRLQKRHWDVRAIRPPTVAQGAARLRVTVKWCNTEEQLIDFAADVNTAFAEMAA